MNASGRQARRRSSASGRAGAPGTLGEADGRFRRPVQAAWPFAAGLLLVVALTLALAACGVVATPTAAPTATGTPAPAATTPTAAPATGASAGATPTSAPATATATNRPPVSSPTATAPTAASPASSTGPATPSAAVVAAIQAVIQRANQEQQQAVAANDPTLMQDTATTTYYAQLAQEFSDLTGAGATAIQLVDLQWGPITLQGATAAQATTTETWRTTFADGSTLQSTDTNVYSLVLEGGAWKIQADQQPGSQVQPPPPGTPSAAPTPGAAPAPGASAGAAGAGQSRNWAGYAATGGTVTAVSGTWTVPTVSAAGGSGADATWVGIGGVSSTDLIQAGTDATAQGGQVVYTAWVEALPQASQTVPLAVRAGDSVSVSIAQQADGTWQITIRNATTGQVYQTSMAYQSSRSSAEWVEEAPSTSAGRRQVVVPLDDFGTVAFSGATAVVDGQQRTVAQAGGRPITMVSATGQALAEPSALGADGASFTVTRTSAPAPTVVPGSGSAPGPTRLGAAAARRRERWPLQVPDAA